jgi:Tfp pilus assembly protein PilZ
MPIKTSADRASVVRDHRAFWRVSESCSLDWRAVGDDPAFAALSREKGVLRNISGGGVCFRAKKDPGVGAMIALSLELPDQPAPVLSIGRVVWSKPLADGFEIGLEFWWIGWKDEDAQTRIRNFIADRLKPTDAPPSGSAN